MSEYEVIGIIGMILIIIGFCSKQQKMIRIFDMIGAMFFVLYGALTNTWSTMTLNAVLILINFIKLFYKGGACDELG